MSGNIVRRTFDVREVTWTDDARTWPPQALQMMCDTLTRVRNGVMPSAVFTVINSDQNYFLIADYAVSGYAGSLVAFSDIRGAA